jgi:hypothetical protein
MGFEFLTRRFEEKRDDRFIVCGGASYTYQWLLDAIGRYQDVLGRAGIAPVRKAVTSGGNLEDYFLRFPKQVIFRPKTR